MTKKNNSWIIALLAMITLTACSNDNDKLARENSTAVLNAGIGNHAKSRTYLGDDSGTQTQIYWSDDESDKFSIAIGNDSYIFTKRGTTSNATAAEFICNDAPTLPAGTYTARYPAETITSHASQKGTKQDLHEYHYMEASFTAPEGMTWNDVPPLTFNTRVAIVKLTLKHDDFKQKSVTGVTIKAGSSTVVTATSTFQGDENGDVEVYFAIPSGNFNMTGVTLHATCEGGEYTATLGDKTLEASKLYRATSSMEKVSIATVTDLSPLVEGETDK